MNIFISNAAGILFKNAFNEDNGVCRVKKISRTKSAFIKNRFWENYSKNDLDLKNVAKKTSNVNFSLMKLILFS